MMPSLTYTFHEHEPGAVHAVRGAHDAVVRPAVAVEHVALAPADVVHGAVVGRGVRRVRNERAVMRASTKGSSMRVGVSVTSLLPGLRAVARRLRGGCQAQVGSVEVGDAEVVLDEDVEAAHGDA